MVRGARPHLGNCAPRRAQAMTTRTCACGCGQALAGRKSRRFYSDACRKRFNRASTPRQDTPRRSRSERESRTTAEPAPVIPDVRATDTKPRQVYCEAAAP